LHKAQLERDLIKERVVNGLRAAKERGVRIGRRKTRPSALIRRLRSKGLTYKQISELANCSQGSVSLEIKEWEEEKAKGIEKNLDDEISNELLEKPKPEKQEQAFEPPPLPIQVVRF
jgi:DNA invertase Pin-like site-specific DNA recombinase